jgi:hypothetical protein
MCLVQCMYICINFICKAAEFWYIPVHSGALRNHDFGSCMLSQGDKCFADICRPIASEAADGSFDVLRPNATSNCCLLTLHAQQDGDDKCFLLEVCEGNEATEVRRPPYACLNTPAFSDSSERARALKSMYNTVRTR